LQRLQRLRKKICLGIEILQRLREFLSLADNHASKI